MTEFAELTEFVEFIAFVEFTAFIESIQIRNSQSESCAVIRIS